MYFTERLVVGFFNQLKRLAAWWNRKKGWFTKRRIAFVVLILISIYILFRLVIYLIIAAGIPVAVFEVSPQEVPIYREFVGTTASIQSVDIRARVEGFLDEMAFEEGDDVNEGALLFVIDKRPFEATLAEAKGQLAKDQAALAFAQNQVERYKSLAEKDYVSKEQYDGYVTQAEELTAAVEADKATVEQAELNLSYCTMVAPFSGRIGRRFVDVGNLVGAGEKTKLAELVQLDPMYIYFSPSGKDSMEVIRHMREGPVEARLVFSGKKVSKHVGQVDFVDNVVAPSTSTVMMRATMPNPERILLPGVYVDVRLKLAEVSDALIIPQKAIQEDQGGPYVMLIGKGKRVEQRYVELGESYDDNQRIMKGLEEGDRIVVDRLQLMKQDMKVRPRIVAKDTGVKTLVWKAIRGY
jgi:RND family efflux transporter MFP subunit